MTSAFVRSNVTVGNRCWPVGRNLCQGVTRSKAGNNRPLKSDPYLHSGALSAARLSPDPSPRSSPSLLSAIIRVRCMPYIPGASS